MVTDQQDLLLLGSMLKTSCFSSFSAFAFVPL